MTDHPLIVAGMVVLGLLVLVNLGVLVWHHLWEAGQNAKREVKSEEREEAIQARAERFNIALVERVEAAVSKANDYHVRVARVWEGENRRLADLEGASARHEAELVDLKGRVEHLEQGRAAVPDRP